MSMRIRGNDMDYKNEHLERAQAEQDKVKETSHISTLKDEYINSEKAGNKPSGLYRMGRDEKGNPKVLYDDPKREAKKTPQQKDSAKQDKKCTVNTDKVDREIEKLKEKKKQIQQQIKAANGDQEKIRELEKKLTQIEGELNQKDNDAYRRQNADKEVPSESRMRNLSVNFCST